MRKKRNELFAILLLAAGLCLFGCGVRDKVDTVETTAEMQEKTDEKTVGTYVEKENLSISDYVLRDDPSIYADDDPSSVVTMYLTVRKGNDVENTNHTWTEVNSYSKYYYQENDIPQYAVEGILQVGDENGPIAGEFGYDEKVPNATVQIRGQTSTRREQKNYKIRIKDNKGQWREQQTIALNKHIGEALRFRNKLAYDLMKEIPQMVSARTQFVHLYVKDETEGAGGIFEDYGLYTQVEQMNKRYLTNHGFDKNGQLYKINFFEFFRYEDVIKLATDETYDLKAFERYLEVKGSNDHTKLIEMLEAVNDYSIPIEKTVEKYFDTDNLLYWIGFHLLTGNGDTEARNYYLYSPLNMDKWYVFSWDNDSAFKRAEYDLINRSENKSWERGISRYWGVVLYQRMFKLEEYRTRLSEIMDDLHSNYLTEENIQSKVQVYSQVVKPYVYALPDVIYAFLTPDQYDMVAAGLSAEVDQDFKDYQESLNKPMPFYLGIPEVIDGKLKLGWDEAYDFDGEAVTYTVELSADPLFTSILDRREGLRFPELETAVLPEGQYFYRVSARNESGYQQDAFDYYAATNGKIYGTKCFYVLSDGSIQEDLYVE